MRIEKPDCIEFMCGLLTFLAGLMLLTIKAEPDMPLARYTLAMPLFILTGIYWLL